MSAADSCRLALHFINALTNEESRDQRQAVAAGILPAVAGGILPPGRKRYERL
jgi:DNA invertase Pin-like site-specific DNA recombinase